MNEATIRKIDRFAGGKAWRVIEERYEDFIIDIGGSVWVIRKGSN